MRKMTEARREAILSAAAEEFGERGFEGASMAAVAARIGGGKQTIYRYFPSKEELFAEVKTRAISKMLEGAFLELNDGDDLEAALQRYGERHLAARQTPEFIGLMRFVYGESGRSDIGRLLLERGKMKFMARIAEVLATAMRTGRLRVADPIVTTFHLFALLDSELVEAVVLRYREPASAEEIARVATRAVEAFFAAYRPSAANS